MVRDGDPARRRRPELHPGWEACWPRCQPGTDLARPDLAHPLRNPLRKVNGDLPTTSKRTQLGALRQDDGVPTELV